MLWVNTAYSRRVLSAMLDTPTCWRGKLDRFGEKQGRTWRTPTPCTFSTIGALLIWY